MKKGQKQNRVKAAESTVSAKHTLIKQSGVFNVLLLLALLLLSSIYVHFSKRLLTPLYGPLIVKNYQFQHLAVTLVLGFASQNDSKPATSITALSFLAAVVSVSWTARASRDLGSDLQFFLARLPFLVTSLLLGSCIWSIIDNLPFRNLGNFLPRTLITLALASVLTALQQLLERFNVSASSNERVLRMMPILLAVLGLPSVLSSSSRQMSKQGSKPAKSSYGLPVSFQLLLATIALFASIYCREATTSSLPWPTAEDAPRLLAQQNGPMGYVSVVEWPLAGRWTRVLRAEHSLIGGTWIGHARDAVMSKRRLTLDQVRGLSTPEQKRLEEQAVQQAESIYTTFYLQEAIRFVQGVNMISPQGLVIGLGAGISGRALHGNGVNVTVCEIDPAVYSYAREFFAFPEVGAVYLEDARRFVQRPGLPTYDYIIHDIFTSGALPPSLFTVEACTDVKKILAENGVLAVNFVGLIDSKLAQAVFTTLQAVFPYCRAFVEGQHSDPYKNIVTFCSKSRRPEFRAAQDSDIFMELGGRQDALLTFLKNEIVLPNTPEEPAFVVRDSTVGSLDQWQKNDTLTHYRVMRKVFPVEFWIFGNF